MNLDILVNGEDVSQVALLSQTEITKDSTQAISTAKLTFLASPNGQVAVFDVAKYDEDYYSFEPSQRDLVVIQNASAVRQFAGYITQIDRKVPVGAPITYDVMCSDFGVLLNAAVITETWTLTSDHQIIMEACGAVPGITVSSGNIATLVASIPTFQAKDISLRAMLENLCALTGGEWRVDYSGALHYYASGSASAPWGVSDQPDGSTTYKVRMDSVRSDFTSGANRIWVLGQLAGGVEIRGLGVDTNSQAKYGILTATVVDRQITDLATAQLRADAEIAQRAWPSVSGQFTYSDATISATPLDIGQTCPVVNGAYNLNASYILRSIKMKQVSDTVSEYTVTFGQRIPDLVLILRRAIQAAQPVTYTPPADITGVKIDITNFATTIEPVNIVTATPDAGGLLQIAKTTSAVTNTYDSKLYRWDPAVSAYRHNIAAGDIDADAVTAGTIAAGAIRATDAVFAAAAIQSADIGSAQITTAKLGDLTIGAGSSKPAWMKVVDSIGSLLAFAGYDSGTGFIGIGGVNARFGPSFLSAPVISCSSSGVAINGAEITVASGGDTFTLGTGGFTIAGGSNTLSMSNRGFRTSGGSYSSYFYADSMQIFTAGGDGVEISTSGIAVHGDNGINTTKTIAVGQTVTVKGGIITNWS